MANVNETTAYGFRIQFKRMKKTKEQAAVSEQEAGAGHATGNAMLDFECYRTHTKSEHASPENTTKDGSDVKEKETEKSKVKEKPALKKKGETENEGTKSDEA